MAKFNKNGEQIPDCTPVEVPVGFGAPESLESMITRLVRVETFRQTVNAEAESFEEADDLEVDDDDPISSNYEVRDLQEEKPDESKLLKPDNKPAVDPDDRDYQEFMAFKAWKEANKKAGFTDPANKPADQPAGQ